MAMRMAVCLIVVLGWFEVTKGAVYKVGDSAGWTTIGNVDYKLWSSTKTFQLGDVIGNFIFSILHSIYICMYVCGGVFIYY